MKQKLLSFLFVIGVMSVFAQDIHFSQYYSFPMALNPALTGKFDGLYRVSGIYRGQYYGVTQGPSLYRTPGLSADFSLLKEKMKGNALGVGLAFVNDQQSNGDKITANTIYLSLAYTLGFGKNKNTQLGVGLMPTVVLKKVGGDYQFGQAFNTDLTYDKNSFYHENIITSQKTYFNFSAGLFFNTKPLKWLNFYAGYSMFNIARPKVSFLTSTSTATSQLSFRHVVHGGFEFDLNKRLVLIPGFLYQNMGKANEANAGITLGIHFINDPEKDKKGTIFIGLWNRMGNNVNTAFNYRNLTPKIGVEYQRFRVGFAYDLDFSNMNKDAKAAGGKMPMAYELAITYIGLGSKPLKENNWLFNPRY